MADVRAAGYFERRLIAAAALLLGLFNVFLAAARAPFAGYGEWDDLVARNVLNGSRFVLVILGMLLISTVPGLLRGKRIAWGIALLCVNGSIVAHPLKNLDLWGTFASLALVGALIGSRPQFPARSDPPKATHGLQTLIIGMAGVFVYAVVGLYFLDREFRHPIGLQAAVRDAIRLMFVVPSSEAVPRTHHAVWFLDSVRVAIVLVLVVGVSQLIAPVVARASLGRFQRERIRALLEKYGRSSIAHFALLPDKAYFFSGDGEAVLAFKVIGSTAVVMGDPIGDEAEFPQLIDAFIEYCRLDGWAFAFHQTTPRHAQLYASRGLKALKIGEEAVVPVQQFSLSGNAMKHLRATMNRFAREGYHATLLEPPHDRAVLERLREISEAWLARGNRRERTFTLGYFDESLVRDSVIMAAFAPDGTIVGFADIVPSYRSGEGNFDMLRYLAEPKDVADFLHVSLIQYFRDRGLTSMSLGLAPFSGLELAQMDSTAVRAMRLLYRYGTMLFRYQGLREYKEKFHPVWEPRYLVYTTELQLPGIALAVGRAGELPRRRRLELLRPGRHEQEPSAA